MNIHISKESSQKTNRPLRIFFRNRYTLIGFILISVIVLSSVCSGYLTKHDPIKQGNLLKERYLEPSPSHLFGTDKFGRDVFSRVLYGGRISLAIAFSVVLFAISLGTFYGAFSGYKGGAVDAAMMRFLDILQAFPAIFLIIAITAIFRLNHWYLIPMLGLTGWMETARLVRAEVLSVKERDYIQAVKGLGFSHKRILFNHIIPNCLAPVVVVATLKIGEIILLESALSFLGLGVQPPTPSWGNIINDGRDVLLRAWWISTFPGFFIVLSVMSFNVLGEGIRKSLNIKG